MDTFIQDLRFGARMMLKKRGFTAVALIALGLGIGANTAIFSVVNAILLRPLPFKQPDRLVKVWPQRINASVSKAEYVEFKEQTQSFDDLAAYSGWSFTVTGKGEPQKLNGARTTASFFSLLGVSAALGRTFLPEEDQPAHSKVIILSHGYWERSFGSDPNILGLAITIDGEPHTIVGVMPKEFNFPSRDAEIWVPAPIDRSEKSDFTAGYLIMLGRLKQGVTMEQAQTESVSVARNACEKFPRTPDNYGLNAAVVSLQKDIVGDIRPTLLILLGAVGFVLLIACANVANIQLARTSSRQKEIAIRTALGARRGRVVRQFLTESVMLSILGGVLGLALAFWGVNLLVGLLPSETPRLNEISVDLQVLGFSLALSLITGILSGLAPALQTSKPDLQETLKEGNRSSSAAIGGRLRSLLIVGEVAIALMLVIGAGLLIKSFWRLQQVNPGFRSENVVSFQLAPPGSKYSEAHRLRSFYHEVLTRIESLPGVEAVGAIHILPLSKNNWNPGLKVEDQPVPQGAQLPLVDWRLVTNNYFRTMAIPLIRGRFFTEHDNENGEPVVIINETLANKYWPNEDPVGKRISSGFERNAWVPIVGVVGDTKHHGLDAQAKPEMYRPYDQSPFASSMAVMVRATSDPLLLASSIRGEVWAVDGDVPIADVRPLAEVVSGSIVKQRSTMLMLAFFAALAMTLGAVGIYGVISYSVTQCTHEIGVRMALGATSKDVLALVVSQGLSLAVIGVGLGICAAFAATRILESLLFGVSATDPVTFATTALLLIAVALTASFIPARRATKVDPMVALRYE